MGEGKFGVLSSDIFTWDSHLMKWEVMQNNPGLFTDELSVKIQTKEKYVSKTVTWTLSNNQFCAADKLSY